MRELKNMDYRQDIGVKMNRFKAKGDRFERELIHLAESFGLKAYRNRMSRANEGEHWDISILDRKFEVKKRGSGFKRIRKWIEGIDGVIVGSDREEPLVVIRFEDFLKLLKPITDIE
jgi:Holliday junction resolvase